MNYELEIKNIKLELPKSDDYVFCWDEKGDYIGDAEYFSKITKTHCCAHSPGGMKGFLRAGHDEDYYEIEPAFWAKVPKNIHKKTLGNEILERIKQFGRENFDKALKTSHRLCNPNPQGSEIVSDGELLDALFHFSSHLDIGNPMGPVLHTIFERYMLNIGMEQTPNGIHRDWFHDEENWEEDISA